MRELESLGWTAGISFLSHGVRFGIRANDAAVLERVLERLPPGWKPARSPVVSHLYSLFVAQDQVHNQLYLQSTRVIRALDLAVVLERLEHSLHFQVATGARRRIFVHAAVAGWHGRAIVVPGRSMSGKTTLIEALVRAGAVYYSDEYAILDAHGRVHPYPKPLFVRTEGSGGRRHVTAESLGGCPGTRPLSVGLVVVTRYEEGARWRPKWLSSGKALLALLDHTLLARSRPDLALETLQKALAGGAVVLKSRRGDAEETARLLLAHLDEEEPAKWRTRKKSSTRGRALGDGSRTDDNKEDSHVAPGSD